MKELKTGSTGRGTAQQVMKDIFTGIDMGLVLCKGCMSEQPFQQVRWDRNRQSYFCTECISK